MTDVYLSSRAELNAFSNVIRASSKKTRIHKNQSYVYYGVGDRMHGTCWKIWHVIGAIALFILSSLLIPLIFKFKSYKNLIEKFWKEGITGREKNLLIYLKIESSNAVQF